MRPARISLRSLLPRTQATIPSGPNATSPRDAQNQDQGAPMSCQVRALALAFIVSGRRRCDAARIHRRGRRWRVRSLPGWRGAGAGRGGAGGGGGGAGVPVAVKVAPQVGHLTAGCAGSREPSTYARNADIEWMSDIFSQWLRTRHRARRMCAPSCLIRPSGSCFQEEVKDPPERSNRREDHGDHCR